jgi:plasmid stabilization system protein ParE
MAAPKPHKWTLVAERQFLEKLAWIARENAPAASKLYERVFESIARLEHYPEIGTPDRKGRRRYPIPQTPFVMFYRVRSRVVIIARFLRQEQDERLAP